MVAASSSCATAGETGFGPQYPCWMNEVATVSQIGQIGVARNIRFGSVKPDELAKGRAIDALCHYLGKVCDDEHIKNALESEQLEGRTLYFDEFDHAGYLYSYASFSKVGNRQCSPQSCNIAQCNPSWLCSPTEGNLNGLLGVSYRATSLATQMQKAIENAFFQAEFLYGVTVTARNTLNQSQFGSQGYLINYRQSEIDLGQRELLSYHVKHQCRSNSTFYRHVVLSDDLPERHRLKAGDIGWITQPKYLGLDGAVGAVEKPSASGLLSDQIKLAIKRAATDLAFEKNSQISEDSVIVIFGDGGLIQVTTIDESTQSELKAQLVGVYFEPQNNSPFLKVFTWVAVIE